MERLTQTLTPDKLKYALFDLKRIEFNTTDDSVKADYLYFDIVNDPQDGLAKLEELVGEVDRRLNNNQTQPLLFIYIEECDIATYNQTRFDTAVRRINNNAKVTNIKLIYSTSRISPATVSPNLVDSFDIILTGELAADRDYDYLGIQKQSHLEQYSFLVTEASHMHE